MPRVLHLTERLSRGGAGRALLSLAATVTGFEHRVVSLEPAGSVAQVAREHGLTVVEAPAAAELHRELAEADLVQVHFWNSPALYEVLAGELPDTRLLLWPHVGGGTAPHVLTAALLGLADMTVASTPYTLDLPALAARAEVRMIPAVGGWQHIDGVRPVPHEGFAVGYVGTVDFAKLHPDFVAMSARVAVPDARFVLCGSGDAFALVERQAEALGIGDRLDLRGWVADVRAVLSELDVFGYPLCEDNYSGSELALHEAMYAGVPPVVLPHGGAQLCVSHGRTGLVASDVDDYPRAVEYLHARPEERRRLGDAAREHAIRTWSPQVLAESWRAAYAELLGGPRRAHSWPRDDTLAPVAARFPGATLLVQSMGERSSDFRASMLAAEPERALEADEAIALSPPALASADAGGILHYRRHYPDDPQLRLWAGLVLERQGRLALAAGEFAGAVARGFTHWRASLYLARVASALGQAELAARAMECVPTHYALRASALSG